MDKAVDVGKPDVALIHSLLARALFPRVSLSYGRCSRRQESSQGGGSTSSIRCFLSWLRSDRPLFSPIDKKSKDGRLLGQRVIEVLSLLASR